MAVSRAFEHGLTDTKATVLERRETDTGDDQVAAQQRGIDGVEPLSCEPYCMRPRYSTIASVTGDPVTCSTVGNQSLKRLSDSSKRLPWITARIWISSSLSS